MMISYVKSAILLWLVLQVATTFAQDEPLPGQPQTTTAAIPMVEDEGSGDAFKRDTPRGSIHGFLEACEAFDFERAAKYLDLRNLPGEVASLGGPELARQFKHVLSRAVWLDDYTVSDDPEGLKGDGLPPYRDELVRIKTREGERVIWLQHVPRDDGELIWKISNRSVALFPELYDEYSYPPGVETVRGWFPEGASFLGLEAFKWFIVILLSLLVWPVFHVVGIALTRVFSSPSSSSFHVVRKIMTGPVVAIGVLLVIRATLLELGMGARAQEVAQSQTLITIVLVWALWSITNLLRNRQQEKLEALGRPGAAKLAQPIATFIKMLVLLLGLLFWLSNLGVNITTVLAGLGVGGLAVALALQKPLEDMMGALTIFSQATIRVGDFCRYGEITGVVEDIGLRTTRLRTLSNTLVSIPNSRIAYVEVENYTARSKIRYSPTLRLRYDTTPDQIREIRNNVLELLQASERVHDEPLRVRFTDFDSDAVLVKVNSYLQTVDFSESLEIGEALNLRIMEIVEAAGARFALPGRSLYLEGGAPAAAAVTSD
ncbi:MAG: mechanosensitive ion channel family protein [Xanthomonadales bacterium]|nr:mechanosensitive ion channel family protein [Xanthomonadales bacterium]